MYIVLSVLLGVLIGRAAAVEHPRTVFDLCGGDAAGSP